MELWLNLDNDDREVIEVGTLDHILKEQGDQAKSISYLKVDIEGFELTGAPFREIFFSGVRTVRSEGPS